jgi:hypothetical protein
MKSLGEWGEETLKTHITFLVIVVTVTTLSATQNKSIDRCDLGDNGLQGIWKEEIAV